MHYHQLPKAIFDREVFCSIVGCGARLKSLDDFEDHYHARHTASCSVCSRVYPTSHLLSIHVSEAHDSFFQAKVARGFAMVNVLVVSAFLFNHWLGSFLLVSAVSSVVWQSFTYFSAMG